MQSDFSFDYIFMDQVMPVMNGSEAIRAIRNLNFINPIIAVTGNTSTEEIIDLLANGADKILTKPLNIKDLERIFDGIVLINC